MIHAREAREIMENSMTEMYGEVLEEINRKVIYLSEKGNTNLFYSVPPKVFDRYGDDIINSLKELGYHVSEVGHLRDFSYFHISWEEENPFLNDKVEEVCQPDQLSEQPKWWQFWK